MRLSPFNLLAAAAVLIFFFGIFGIVGKQFNDCDRRGGTLVRGAIWYVCVVPK